MTILCVSGRGFGNHVEGVWQLSVGYRNGVLSLYGRCLEYVWSVSIGRLNGNLVFLNGCRQDRSGKSKGRSSQNRSGCLKGVDWIPNGNLVSGNSGLL